MLLKSIRSFAFAFAASLALTSATDLVAEDSSPFQLVVMDPLAAPLSCPCVEGYAQRKYEALAGHIEKTLGHRVQITFAESLAKALKNNGGQADLVIGKDSVVRADAAAAKIEITAVAALADKKGATEQYGLIVVRKDDPAKRPVDLLGYEIIFGPAESDEKHAAAIDLLKGAGVTIPEKLVIDQACSDGATKVIEVGSKKRMAAVISSYAAPLLEGCGTIKKGDLRVVGKTRPVPFITAFVNNLLDKTEREAVQSALFSVVESPAVCEKLESLIGFVDPIKKK